VVDVPGLFHSKIFNTIEKWLSSWFTDPTKYQTKEDAVIIRNLIGDYINDRRTIILYVLILLIT
jgi:hypothetical protein